MRGLLNYPMSNVPTPDELRLRIAGRAGKLWRVTVRFTTDYSNETKIFERENMTWDDLEDFRLKVYQRGLLLPMDPGHWIAVPPWEVKEIHCYKQEKFFEP